MVPGDSNLQLLLPTASTSATMDANKFNNSHQTVSYSSHHIFKDMKGTDTSTRNMYIIYLLLTLVLQMYSAHTHNAICMHEETLHTIVTSSQCSFLQGPAHSYSLQRAAVTEGVLPLTVSFCSVVHIERPASTADGRATDCIEDWVTCMLCDRLAYTYYNNY